MLLRVTLIPLEKQYDLLVSGYKSALLQCCKVSVSGLAKRMV